MYYIIAFFVVIFGIMGLLIVFNLSKNVYSEEDGFSQAGVAVSNSKKTISIKGDTYNLDAVTRITYESGLGPRGNISRAKIVVRDMHRPVHQIDFMTPGAAQTFANRLSVALEQAGGPRFD